MNLNMRFKGLCIVGAVAMLVLAVNVLPYANRGVFTLNTEGKVFSDEIIEELNSGGYELGYFSSEEELVEHMEYTPPEVEYSWLDAPLGQVFEIAPRMTADNDMASMAGESSGGQHSEVNNQVEGVEELDKVRTNGKDIFIASNSNVTIVDAWPPEEAGVVARIELEDWSVEGLFLHGNRLIVIQRVYVHEEIPGYDDVYSEEDYYRYYPYYSYSMTNVLVYNIADASNPELVRNYSVSGYYSSSRMIANHLYLLTNDYIYRYDDALRLPHYVDDGDIINFTVSDIGYIEDSKGSGQTVLITALDVASDQGAEVSAILTGYGCQIYMSRGNMYIASAGGYSDVEFLGAWLPKSTMYKFNISGLNVRFGGSAVVPGTVLNQFSMDEHKGDFRVATTVGRITRSGSSSINNVYVLSGDMEIVGRIEGLAPGERIYSARFVGDRGYIVTYKQVDPFYVIDLSDPTSPEVLGYLKVPGFSNYMHPLDEDHVIGIGRDTIPADEGDFSWFQGLKLSLFDVTDPENPLETSKLVIGDRGTSSPAEYDHKAFLYSSEHGKIVIPVSIYDYGYQTIELDDGDEGVAEVAVSSVYESDYWQGAYVISVDPETGFNVTGTITHMDENSSEPYEYYYYWGSYDRTIFRAVTIEDCLYTISGSMVKAHDINELTEIASIDLYQ